MYVKFFFYWKNLYILNRKGEFGDIVIPIGKAINQPNYQNSYFFNSEYLVYDESQVYTRYLLKIQIS